MSRKVVLELRDNCIYDKDGVIVASTLNMNYNFFECDEFREEKKWYEKPESFPCLCWVADDSNGMNTVSLIKEYEPENIYPFITETDIEWRHAAPLTKSELLSYCLEEK